MYFISKPYTLQEFVVALVRLRNKRNDTDDYDDDDGDDDDNYGSGGYVL